MKKTQEHKHSIFIFCLILMIQFGLHTAFAMPSNYNQENNLGKEAKKTHSSEFLQKSDDQNSTRELSINEPSFLIKSIEIEGNYLDKVQWLKKLLKSYEGQHINMKDVDQIIKKATDELHKRGFGKSKILLKEKHASNGIIKLKFQFIPKIVRDISFKENYYGNWKNAFPIRTGDILNEHKLKQGEAQLNRLHSQRPAKAEIVPTEKEDEIKILITGKKSKSWKWGGIFDNSGSELSGSLRAAEWIIYDNPFNGNDFFEISLSGNLINKKRYGAVSNSIRYVITNGNYTHSFYYSGYDYYQNSDYNGRNTLTYYGSGNLFNFKTEKLLERTEKSDTHLELGITNRQRRNFVYNAETYTQPNETNIFTTSLIYNKRIGTARFNTDAGYVGEARFRTRFTHKYGNIRDNTQKYSTAPSKNYNIWNLNLFFVKPFVMGKKRAEYKTSFNGQFTNNRLFAIDSFYIGPRNTVRGFNDEQTLTAEKGWYLQNEISFPIAKIAKNQLNFFFGVDYGRVSGPSYKLKKNELVSGLAGLRGKFGPSSQEFNYEILVAKRNIGDKWRVLVNVGFAVDSFFPR